MSLYFYRYSLGTCAVFARICSSPVLLPPPLAPLPYFCHQGQDVLRLSQRLGFDFSSASPSDLPAAPRGPPKKINSL